MKIYLLDWNRDMCHAWERYFSEDVEIVNNDFIHFMNLHEDIDGIVSPANCFGIMDGGYDAAISRYLGPEVSERVRDHIINKYYGIQPLTTCLPVQVSESANQKKRLFLLHTPIMTTPETVKDPVLIFHAMRNTLMAAIDLRLESIVIPAWGGSCGGVDFDEIARYMSMAYEQIKHPYKELDWSVMGEMQSRLNFWENETKNNEGERGLNRFVNAQKNTYDTALVEMLAGKKVGHWMWYIFPQIHGLSIGKDSLYYSIHGRAEAEAYLQYPILGKRLREITGAILRINKNDAEGIFGGLDSMKLKSSMTLFYLVSEEVLFKKVLNKFYDGEIDDKTVELLVKMDGMNENLVR